MTEEKPRFKEFEFVTILYFEDKEGNDYRATSINNIQKRYGESWEDEYSLSNNQQINEEFLKFKKATTDNQRIREALKKILTSEYEGQVAVMPEYYKLLKELELEDE